MKIVKASWLLLFLFYGAWCLSVEAAGPEKTQCIVGYSVKGMSDVDPRDAQAALRVWAQETGRKFGFYVETNLYDSVDVLVKDFNNKKLDLVVVSSIDFLRLSPTLKVKPEMSPIRNGKSTTKYVLVVGPDIQKKGLTGLKNKNLAIPKTDQLGMLFLNTHLLKANLPEAHRFFGVIQEKSKESQAILAVFFGQADACVVSDTAFNTMVELNPQVGRKLHVAASSPELMDAVGFFHPDYPASHKEKAIQGMRGGIKDYQRGKQIMLLFNIDRMDTVNDDQLDSVRKLLAEYGRLKKIKSR